MNFFISFLIIQYRIVALILYKPIKKILNNKPSPLTPLDIIISKGNISLALFYTSVYTYIHLFSENAPFLALYFSPLVLTFFGAIYWFSAFITKKQINYYNALIIMGYSFSPLFIGKIIGFIFPSIHHILILISLLYIPFFIILTLLELDRKY